MCKISRLFWDLPIQILETVSLRNNCKHPNSYQKYLHRRCYQIGVNGVLLVYKLYFVHNEINKLLIRIVSYLWSRASTDICIYIHYHALCLHHFTSSTTCLILERVYSNSSQLNNVTLSKNIYEICIFISYVLYKRFIITYIV